MPHLTQDTNGKVTNSQLDTTKESQEVSPFPAGDYKAHIIRHAQKHRKQKTEKTQQINKRSIALEWSVKYFTGGLKPVQRQKFVLTPPICVETSGRHCFDDIGNKRQKKHNRSTQEVSPWNGR